MLNATTITPYGLMDCNHNVGGAVRRDRRERLSPKRERGRLRPSLALRSSGETRMAVWLCPALEVHAQSTFPPEGLVSTAAAAASVGDLRQGSRGEAGGREGGLAKVESTRNGGSCKRLFRGVFPPGGFEPLDESGVLPARQALLDAGGEARRVAGQ